MLSCYFQFWSDVAVLDFEKLPSGTPIFDISFQVGDHGDGVPFDGPGTVLAHAFYPLGGNGLNGDTHYDDQDTFTFNTSLGKLMILLNDFSTLFFCFLCLFVSDF